MAHGYFDDAESRILNLAHHLETDDTGVAFELHTIEDLAAHQPEVAVDIADAQPEQTLDRVVVNRSDDDAVRRIRAAKLEAVHHVGVGGEPVPQELELRGIVLRIAVRVGDEVLGGCRKSGTQSAAVAAVDGMV